MIFYSGFSLTNEAHFFDKFLENSDYTVSGFSYGAIKAARYASESKRRIDTLQLFSPAFFQTKKESFRRLQLTAFNNDPEIYLDRFIQGCFAPSPVQDIEVTTGTIEELDELLHYVWDDTLMRSIVKKGIRIEVYLGLEDKIIDAQAARDFFLPFATVTSIRQGNHFLQECI